MKCRDIEEHMPEYIYGELEPASRKAMDSHLAECPDCASLIASFQNVRDRLKHLPEPEPSTMVVNRILVQARDQASHGKSHRGFRWVPWLAGACLLVVAGIVTSHQMELGPWDSVRMTKEMPAATVKGERPSTETGAGDKIQPAAIKESLPKPQSSPSAATQPPAPAAKRAVRGLTMELTEPLISDPPKSVVASKTVATPAVLTEEAGEKGASGPKAKEGSLTGDSEESAVFFAQKLSEGQTALSGGQYDLAAKLFEALIVEIPRGHRDRPKALLGLAQAYEAKGASAVAVQTYRALADESPEYRDLALQHISNISSK